MVVSGLKDLRFGSTVGLQVRIVTRERFALGKVYERVFAFDRYGEQSSVLSVGFTGYDVVAGHSHTRYVMDVLVVR